MTLALSLSILVQLGMVVDLQPQHLDFEGAIHNSASCISVPMSDDRRGNLVGWNSKAQCMRCLRFMNN